MTEDKAAAAIRSLYATGFFKDVALETEGGVLVVVVQERPAIAQIDFVRQQGIRQGDQAQGASRRSAWPRAAFSTAACWSAPSRS